MMHTIYFFSPIGPVAISGDATHIHRVAFVEATPALPDDPHIPALLVACRDRLASWFEGSTRILDLPLAPQGTPFQQQVWQLVSSIPHGRTSTYRDLAIRMGEPGLTRAVGTAIGRNPILLIIPCHRIIGADGRLTGYAGGLHRKRWLLEHERSAKQGLLF